MTQILYLSIELAFRQCSERGFWIAQDGREADDPSWTNFSDCFTTELHKVISDLSNSSGSYLYIVYSKFSNMEKGGKGFHVFSNDYFAQYTKQVSDARGAL